MATLTSIFIPSGSASQSGTLTSNTSSVEIVLYNDALFAINGSGDLNIKFGGSGMANAAVSDFRIPSGVVATYDTGRQFDRIKLFNSTAGNVTYWIQLLVRS